MNENDANWLSHQSGRTDQSRANSMTPVPGDYDPSTGVRLEIPGRYGVEKPQPRSVPEIRREHALEAALRHVHPGAVTAEVIRVAREFEAYLTGAGSETFKRYSGHDELTIGPADTTARLP